MKPSRMLAVFAVGSVLLASCSSGSQSSLGSFFGRGAGGPPKPTPSANAQPGVITGRVVDSRGNPVADAEVRIQKQVVTGVDTPGPYATRTDVDGRYKQEVPDGNYQIQAFKDVRYNGYEFRMPLYPLDDLLNKYYDARPGVVKDFMWRLSGNLPSDIGPGDPYHSAYGASIVVANGAGKFVKGPQWRGAKIAMTLTPDGKLIDGSDGQVLHYTYAFKPDDSDLYVPTYARPDGIPIQLYWPMEDIPVGRYQVIGQVVMANGDKLPLQIDGKASLQVSFVPKGGIAFASPDNLVLGLP